MTLPASGSMSMSQIQSEFNLGNNLNAYRSGRWYLDTNGRGYFSGGSISFSDFYSKRKSSPVSAGGPITLSRASWDAQRYTFPMFNNFYVTTYSGTGGTDGQGGNCDGGTAGTNGGATSFGGYGTSAQGSHTGYGGSPTPATGSASWSIDDANQATILAMYNTQTNPLSIGGPGNAGSKGANSQDHTVCYRYGYVNGFYVCTGAYVYSACDAYLNDGSNGGPGYIVVSWN